MSVNKEMTTVLVGQCHHKTDQQLDMVVHTCNPNIGRLRQDEYLPLGSYTVHIPALRVLPAEPHTEPVHPQPETSSVTPCWQLSFYFCSDFIHNCTYFGCRVTVTYLYLICTDENRTTSTSPHLRSLYDWRLPVPSCYLFLWHLPRCCELLAYFWGYFTPHEHLRLTGQSQGLPLLSTDPANAAH